MATALDYQPSPRLVSLRRRRSATDPATLRALYLRGILEGRAARIRLSPTEPAPPSPHCRRPTTATAPLAQPRGTSACLLNQGLLEPARTRYFCYKLKLR